MANNDIENPLGVTDKRNNTRAGSGVGSMNANIANYDDVTSLRARLTAAAAASYPAVKLDAMTKNDMVYALRLIDDPTGIK